jgi:hypothetical protein
MKSSTENIRLRVVEWNRKFPLDLWWRRKHNIAFGSSSHNEVNLFDMRFEYEEDRLSRINKIALIKKVKISDILELIEEKIQNNLSLNKELEEEFENIDLEQFNDPQ